MGPDRKPHQSSGERTQTLLETIARDDVWADTLFFDVYATPSQKANALRAVALKQLAKSSRSGSAEKGVSHEISRHKKENAVDDVSKKYYELLRHYGERRLGADRFDSTWQNVKDVPTDFLSEHPYFFLLRVLVNRDRHGLERLSERSEGDAVLRARGKRAREPSANCSSQNATKRTRTTDYEQLLTPPYDDFSFTTLPLDLVTAQRKSQPCDNPSLTWDVATGLRRLIDARPKEDALRETNNTLSGAVGRERPARDVAPHLLQNLVGDEEQGVRAKAWQKHLAAEGDRQGSMIGPDRNRTMPTPSIDVLELGIMLETHSEEYKPLVRREVLEKARMWSHLPDLFFDEQVKSFLARAMQGEVAEMHDLQRIRLFILSYQTLRAACTNPPLHGVPIAVTLKPSCYPKGSQLFHVADKINCNFFPLFYALGGAKQKGAVNEGNLFKAGSLIIDSYCRTYPEPKGTHPRKQREPRKVSLLGFLQAFDRHFNGQPQNMIVNT